MSGMDRYLRRRAGIYRVRIRVPDELRPILGKLELVKSLGTGSKTEARRLAPAIIAGFLAQIEAARPKWQRVPGYDPFDPLSPAWSMGDRVFRGLVPPGVPAPPAPSPEVSARDTTFTAILDTWKLEHSNPDTLKKYTRMMGELAEHAGTDDGNKITPQQIVAFETKLRRAGKLHPNTISSYLTAFNSLFTFAMRKFIITVNPMADVKVPGKIDSNIQPYSTEQVQRIVGEARKLRLELFLCVAVQSYTGCRISEIANRRVADIRLEDGIWCLIIPTGKTKSSERIIPLHPAVLTLLLPYRQGVVEKHGDDALLFPELPRGGTGKPTAYITRELCRWIRDDLRIRDENLQPNHSYRHYVKSRLLKAKVDLRHRDMICGHGVNVARKYEHGDIEDMAAAISLLPDPLHSLTISPT
jgi:integrase